MYEALIELRPVHPQRHHVINNSKDPIHSTDTLIKFKIQKFKFKFKNVYLSTKLPLEEIHINICERCLT